MRPTSGSISSLQLSHNNNYQTSLLEEEEQKYAHETTEQTQTQTQLQIQKTRPRNFIPTQNVLRICALSIVLSSGYAVNAIAVFRSMCQGINNKEIWAILYILSSIWLCVLCYGMIYITFRGIKTNYISFILLVYLIGGCAQVLSLILGVSFLSTHGRHAYISWQFELLYSLLPFYTIFLIYFCKTTTARIKMLQLAIFSFILFITPCLRFLIHFYESTVCIALIITFVLITIHLWCFFNHYNSGLAIKLAIISLLAFCLYRIIYIGSQLDFHKYYPTDTYRIYYYYILLTALYIIYACEMFITVPPKIITKTIQHLKDRESFNTEIEKYDGTVKLSMSNTKQMKQSNAYTVQSLFDIATDAIIENENTQRKYNPYYKSINPNEKIESVIKIFPDFKPCKQHKDEYFSELNIGNMNNEKDMERLTDSIACIVPFYNEAAHEIYATLRSLYLCFNYLKKTQTKYNFTHFNVLLVSDGWFKADITTKRYLLKLYKGAEIDDAFNNISQQQNKYNTVILQTKGNQKLCINPFNNSEDKLFLKVTTIIKIDNRKKANSHEWFLGKYGFAEFCKCDFMYFTDAYSTLNPKGLYQMLMHMNDIKNKDVICCTGRARVYSRKQEIDFQKLIREEPIKKKKKKNNNNNSWWKHEIFKMSEDDIEENNDNTVYNIMDKANHSECSYCSVNSHLRNCQQFEFEALYGTIGCYLLGGFLPVVPGPCGFYRSEYVLQDSVRGWYFDKINDTKNINLVTGNMKLAEDRILTITSILNCPTPVRHSLISDCIFYFDPQPNLKQLMKQRRRWINGSIATVIYVLKHVAFTEWEVNWFRKQYVLCLWYMQLAMYTVLFLSPPIIFVVSFHYGLTTILLHITHMSETTINIVAISLQLMSWIIYLFFIFCAQMAETANVNTFCDLKSKSVRIMLAISYTFGLLTVIGSIIQFVNLFQLIIINPKKIFQGEINEFNFFVLTIECIFLVQSFILAPLFSKDIKTLLILLKTGFHYFIYSPFYVIFFFINAIANVHDLSWGTRPDNQSHSRGRKKAKNTTRKILCVLLLFNIIIAASIQPITQFFYARMAFFGLLSLPSVFVIVFSLIWLLKTNLMDLLISCQPKRVEDQFQYIYKSINNNDNI